MFRTCANFSRKGDYSLEVNFRFKLSIYSLCLKIFSRSRANWVWCQIYISARCFCRKGKFETSELNTTLFLPSFPSFHIYIHFFFLSFISSDVYSLSATFLFATFFPFFPFFCFFISLFSLLFFPLFLIWVPRFWRLISVTTINSDLY